MDAPDRSCRWLNLLALIAAVTLPVCWVGWHLGAVRERQTALTWINERQIGYVALDRDREEGPDNQNMIRDFGIKAPVRVPTTSILQSRWLREQLGDEAIAIILLSDKSETPRVQRLFPEALIIEPEQ